ncbi:TPA: helix-turn-helix domain-containing protein [Streptococcus suis]|nr:helix-turn-helix domain-containing protein [Streptococcus suis]
MKNILGNAIKDLRKSKKLTQKQLSELTGYKQNTISNHENGNRQLDENDIRVYAKALDVSPQTLFDKTNPRPSTSIPLPNFDPRQAILMSNYSKLNDTRKNKLLATSETLLAEEQGKIIDKSEKRAEYDARKRISLSVPGKVSAGTGYWQEDDYDTMVDFYADDIPDESKYDTVAVVVGHSMEPKIKNGDFLFIKLTTDIPNGSISIWQVHGENFVKKFRKNGKPYLESLNPEFDNVDLHENDDIRSLGIVVDIYREN